MIEAQNTRKEALFVPQNIQRCFQRYEKKYLLNPEQYQKIRAGLAPYMEADEHGRYTICNLYYDTPDFQLIRASLDKPVYKEKLRMRSYGVPADGDSVFVELKKKYKGVVYKRRTVLEAGEALDYLAGRCSPRAKDQICREIDWFLGRYHPVPQVFIAYDREALAGRGDPGVRGAPFRGPGRPGAAGDIRHRSALAGHGPGPAVGRRRGTYHLPGSDPHGDQDPRFSAGMAEPPAQ